MPIPLEITPQTLKARLDAGETVHLIDVREPAEHAIARIPGAMLIPMRHVPAELQSLEAKSDEAPLVIYCHHGVRSLQVTHWLREQGIDSCQSLAGGIEMWSVQVDPTVPRY